MVQTTSILQLAQQGHPQAIAVLINQNLQPKGITAKVVIKEQTLKVLLEGSVVPNQASLTAFVLQGVIGLKLQTLNKLQVFGKSMEQSTPAWTQVYPLNTISVKPNAVDSSVATKVSAPSDNLEEIAELLNRAIADDQITIKAVQEDNLLKIIVETNKLLDGQPFASRIFQELKTADLSKFETVSVYKQKLRSSHSFRIKSFSLLEPKDELTQSSASQLEDAPQAITNSRKLSSEGRASDLKAQANAKPKIKVGRLISVAVIGVLAAFFIIRTLKRMIVVLWLSPALGSFSIILGLVILWRAWSVLNPLLQALLRDE